MSRISTPRMYLAPAFALWVAAVVLGVVDISDGDHGTLTRGAILLAIPAATLTVLGWLQCHLHTAKTAYDAGVTVATVRYERAHIASMN